MSIFPPYTALQTAVQNLSKTLDQRLEAHLLCQAGCSGCCQQHLTLNPIETAAITEAIAALPSAQQQHVLAQAQAADADPNSHQGCPLLDADQCSIYDARPIICRTHGYPIVFQEEDAPEGEVSLDVCPLNFQTPGALEALAIEDTLDIDRLNLRLAAINFVYCRDTLADETLASQRYSLIETVIHTLARPTDGKTD
jgi:Fe-S-cluster containining protein